MYQRKNKTRSQQVLQVCPCLPAVTAVAKCTRRIINFFIEILEMTIIVPSVFGFKKHIFTQGVCERLHFRFGDLLAQKIRSCEVPRDQSSCKLCQELCMPPAHIIANKSSVSLHEFQLNYLNCE